MPCTRSLSLSMHRCVSPSLSVSFCLSLSYTLSIRSTACWLQGADRVRQALQPREQRRALMTSDDITAIHCRNVCRLQQSCTNNMRGGPAVIITIVNTTQFYSCTRSPSPSCMRSAIDSASSAASWAGCTRLPPLRHRPAASLCYPDGG